MKRVILSVVAGLTLGASIAQAAEVPSVNIVGFKRITVPSKTALAKGWTITGVQFVPFDPTLNGVIDPNSLVSTTIMTPLSDGVYVYDQGIGQYSSRLSVYSNTTSHLKYWTSWAAWGLPVTNSMYVGQGFWMYSNRTNVRDTALAGEALLQGAYTNPIVANFQMVCYPYAMDVAITNMNLTNGVTSFTGATSDKMYVFDTATGAYKTYAWMKRSGAPYWGTVGSASSTADIIPIGTGFWYEHKSTGFNWIAPRPYLN